MQRPIRSYKPPPGPEKLLFYAHTICHTFFVYRIINTRFMKNADKPFIGIIIVTIAVLYSVIALLS